MSQCALLKSEGKEMRHLKEGKREIWFRGYLDSKNIMHACCLVVKIIWICIEISFLWMQVALCVANPTWDPFVGKVANQFQSIPCEARKESL